MPGFIARKLCPDLVIVPLHFDKYREVSNEVRKIFATYDPNFAPMSLDEAHLDLTEHLALRPTLPEHERCVLRTDIKSCSCPRNDLHNIEDIFSCCDNCGLKTEVEKVVFGFDAEEAVNELRLRIEVKTRLTASAGIAPTLQLAKVTFTNYLLIDSFLIADLQ